MNTNKEGYALIMSLVFVGLVAMGATLLFRVTTQKVYFETKNANRIKARIIAEAGVRRAYAQIKDDSSALGEPFGDLAIGGDVAEISLSNLDENGGNGLSSVSGGGTYYLLSATGNCNGETARAAVVIKSTSSSSAEPVSPEILQLFDGAIFCGGDARMVGGTYIDLAGATAHVNGSLTMTGSAQFRNGGSVSSSSRIDMSGGNSKIYGDAIAPSIPLPSWAKWMAPDYFITGAKTEAEVPEQMIEINLEPFRMYAAAHDVAGNSYKNTAWDYVFTDSYFSEDEMPKNGTLTIGAKQTVRPSCGVLWVEGDITFAGSSVVQGCVIATGNIKVCGGMEHKPDGGLPSFMSLNGDVDIAAGCTVYGLVYAHNGEIKISGDADVEGAFICPRGDFDNSGSGKVIYDNSRPYGPNGENVMLPEAVGGEEGGIPEVVKWVL